MKNSYYSFTEMAFSATISTAGKSGDSEISVPTFMGYFAAFIVPELIFL